MTWQLKDLTGKSFGMLTVEKRNPQNAPDRAPRWDCLCGCGKRSTVKGADLRSGATKSCGCQARFKTHGLSYSVEYQTWKAMLQRCENPRCEAFPGYGGRGISVCESWHSFENFYADMGAKPPGLTIERINNDGNYEPGNCKWATKSEQQRNRRRPKQAERRPA